MAHERQFYSYLLGRVILRTVLLIGIIVFGFAAVQNWVARWDLTRDKRYSISDVSRRMAAQIKDPLTIRAYFSGKIPDHVLGLQQLVFDVLAEYEAASKGRIKVERYDPFDSPAAAKEAESYGVSPIQLPVIGATERSVIKVFGSIVLIYGDRAPQIINIADRYGEGYEGLSSLEADVTGKIVDLSQEEKPKIGITGYLEREGGGNPMMGMQPPTPEFNWLRSRLGKDYEVEEVDLNREDLDPKKIRLLVLVRPKELSDVALFRLDQYLMKGGRAIVFLTQGQLGRGFDGRLTFEPFKTGLDGWLEHQGLRVPNEFVCHLVHALEALVPIGDQMSAQVPVWFWPTFSLKESFDTENPAVQKLQAVSMLWPHPVDVLEGKLDGKKATVLVRSHPAESWRWKDLTRIEMQEVVKRDVPAEGSLTSSPVAVALEGTFTSYFAERPVPPSLTAKEEEGHGEEEGKKPPDPPKEGEAQAEPPKDDGKPAEPEKKPKGPDVVKKSETETQLVVVGNAVFISDPVIGKGGDQAEMTAALALNLVTWLSGSPELIALRAKRYTSLALVDEQLNKNIEAWQKEYLAGEMDQDTFRDHLDKAREDQQARRKRSRWLNVVLPIFVILFAGAVVWVLRAATRAAKTALPPPEPPQSLAGGERPRPEGS